MTQNKVELAEKLSKESHQGQKYGPHDYLITILKVWSTH
jgi:hypothetical protein